MTEILYAKQLHLVAQPQGAVFLWKIFSCTHNMLSCKRNKNMKMSIIRAKIIYKGETGCMEGKEGKSKKALISGSYDPFTVGHLSLLKIATDIFHEVHVVIFKNSGKKRMFDAEEMVEGIKKVLATEGIKNCIISHEDGMLADYCRENEIQYNVRGLRNSLDFEYEESLMYANSLLNKELKPIYLRGEGKVSSSMVREFLLYGKDVSSMVPPDIFNIILRHNGCMEDEEEDETGDDTFTAEQKEEMIRSITYLLWKMKPHKRRDLFHTYEEFKDIDFMDIKKEIGYILQVVEEKNMHEQFLSDVENALAKS